MTQSDTKFARPKIAIQISNYLGNQTSKQTLWLNYQKNTGKRKCYSEKLILIKTN